MQSSSSNTPLVSVVMATYNGEKFLRKQLDSLFSQTYPNLEIIAIDDCSSDSSVQILNEYAEGHANMKVFVNDRNLKHIKTFERGASLASGDFISFCDQDDIWDRTKTAVLVQAWKPGASLAYCDSLFIDEKDNSLEKKLSDIKNLESHSSPLPFMIGNCVSGHAALYSKVLIQKAMPFPNEIIHDWWLAFVASTMGQIIFVDKPLVHYRQHRANVIGAIKTKGRKKQSEANQNELIRKRLKLFYEKCPADSSFKETIKGISESYQTFSLKNNFKRSQIFFKHRQELLATKKRSAFRQWLFCLKMFFKII